MRSIARFLVKYRVAVALLFVAMAAVSALAILHVNVNKDMTQYLPKDMAVKQGMDIMEEEFGNVTLVDIMVKDVPRAQRQQLADDLADFDYVSSISYKENDPDYNQGGSRLSDGGA